MSTNNPRKNKEARESAPIVGEVQPSVVAQSPVVQPTPEVQSPVVQPTPEVQSPAAQQASAIKPLDLSSVPIKQGAKCPNPPASTSVAGASEEMPQPAQEVQPPVGVQSLVAQPAQEVQPSVSEKAATAAEMLAQAEQQRKKAKAEASQKKRAQEAESAQNLARIRKMRRRIIVSVVTLILVALCVAASFFCFDRWFAYNDKADFQGTWKIEGKDATVNITKDYIELTDEIAYRYRLDPNTKTIKFSFGEFDGEGYYRFSLDRNQLSITDGRQESETDGIIEDAGWWVNAQLSKLFGKELTPTVNGESLALIRE